MITTRCSAAPGDDLLDALDGRTDTLDGGTGNDTLLADIGLDHYTGGKGHDWIDNDTSNDDLFGSSFFDDSTSGFYDDTAISSDTTVPYSGDDTARPVITSQPRRRAIRMAGRRCPHQSHDDAERSYHDAERHRGDSTRPSSTGDDASDSGGDQNSFDSSGGDDGTSTDYG